MRRPSRVLAILTGMAMSATALAALPADAQTAPARCYGQVVTNTTTINADGAIVGTPGRDIIRAGPGDDVIFGGGGNDIICGGGGDDRIFGQGGWDILIGNGGDDIIRGGNGLDRLWGADGNDSLYGEAGVDYLIGMNGNDLLVGAAGDDNLYGGPGNDRVFGGPDNDDVRGDAGADVCRGDTGIDTATNCEVDLSSENPTPIMLIGDGTTGGASNQVSYRPDLVRNLRGAECGFNMVGRSFGHKTGGAAPAINFNVDQSHEARLGTNIAPATGQVRAAFEGYTKFNAPEIVVIQLGANDMFQWKDPAATAANIGWMIDEIKADFPNTKVIVSNIFHLDMPRITADPDVARPADRDDDGEADMAEYNTLIKQVADQKADAFVDIHTGLTDAQFSVDGIVPNAAGEAIIADRMFNKISPFISSCV